MVLLHDTVDLGQNAAIFWRGKILVQSTRLACTVARLGDRTYACRQRHVSGSREGLGRHLWSVYLLLVA